MTTTPNHSEASPSATNPRYLLGNEANRIFMASQTYGFLDFGRGSPPSRAAPAGSMTTAASTQTRESRPGSPAG